MQFIELSQDQIAVLDDEDFTRLSIFHWSYRGERNGRPGYAVRHVKDGKQYRSVYLHREVAGAVLPGHEVVFLNGDRLDCRRVNLRAVTKEEARRLHRRARSNSASGIKGLTYNPRAHTWSVDIICQGKERRVGTFLTQKEATDAYQEALQNDHPDLPVAPELIER
jgi:hypothetical protein